MLKTFLFSCLLLFVLFDSQATCAQSKWDKHHDEAFFFGAPSNPVFAWNEVAFESVRRNKISTPEATRIYALVNSAMYDAVNGIKTAWGIDPRGWAILNYSGNAPWLISRRASVSAAAFSVLSLLFPDQIPIFQKAFTKELDALGGIGFPWIDNGVEWGKYVGYQVIQARFNDGSWPKDVQLGIESEGHFAGDFTEAHYRYMEPFAIKFDWKKVVPAPPELGSEAYIYAFKEVDRLGSKKNIDPDVEALVLFWKSSRGTARISGEWLKIAINVASNQPTRYSISETARLFALVSLAMADTIAPVWSVKFRYHFWRPATAIRFQSLDSKIPHAPFVENWLPRHESIGNTPDYISEKSAISFAAASVLAGFYCNDYVSFSFSGDKSSGRFRAYQSFTEAANEVVRADLLGGLSFNFSLEAGANLGQKIAFEILKSKLLKVDHNDRGFCPE